MTARARCRQPSRPRRPGGSAQPDVVGRLPPSLDRRGPAPWGRRSRPLLAPGRRRVPEGRAGRPARRGRPGDGGLAKRDGRGPPSSLDQGRPHASERFQRLTADHGLTCSMSRAGKVWDTWATERFLSPPKTERTARKAWRTRDTARADLFDPSGASPTRPARPQTGAHPSPATFERQAVLPRLPAHETSSRPSCPGQCR